MKRGTCKHFTGIGYDDDNRCCAAGVRYNDVIPNPELPGSGYRVPCIRERKPSAHQLRVLQEFGPAGACDKYEEPTEAELATDKQERDAALANWMLVLPLIVEVKQEHEGQHWKGIKECPVCKGRLHMSHAASNGHVWGKCETEGCVAWME